MNTAYPHADEMPDSHRAASLVIPILLEAIGPIQSVVDLGGGDGGWLRAFQDQGVQDVLLLDVSEVEPVLMIDRKSFLPVDLRIELPSLKKKYDLAVCLECVEHLPHSRSRDTVQWLTKAADIVAFSAAIPAQSGRGHINCQPPSFWAELFREQGFERHDILRPRILKNDSIPFWYRQNLYLFTSPNVTLQVNEPDFIPSDFHLIHNHVVKQMLYRATWKEKMMNIGYRITSKIRTVIGLKP